VKKSKMIELLAEDLGVNYGLDFLTDYPEAVAKGVIEFLESKGMLPPEYMKQITLIDRYDVNEWEPEDEA
jgi:hypothetical protein